MSGRRSHPRFALTMPWDGAVRLLRDVIVDQTGDDELLVICHAPGVVGEHLSLDLITGTRSLALRVQVLESRPVIVDASVRHQIRVQLIPDALPNRIAERDDIQVGATGTTGEAL